MRSRASSCTSSAWRAARRRLARDLNPPHRRQRALGRNQTGLRDDRGAAAGQRLLPHVLQLGHARPVRHRRRQSGGGVLRHQRRPRLGRRADSRLPHRRLATRRGARSPRRPAVRRGDTRPGCGGAPHQRRDRPLFRDRAAKRRTRIHRIDRAGVLPRPAGLRRRPPHRRRLHHTAGDGVQQLAARRRRSMP